MNPRPNAAFTLIELLTAVALSVLLVTSLTVLFFRSTEIITIGEARMSVYENGRSSLDIIAADFANAIPSASGQQHSNFVDGGDSTGTDRDFRGAHDALGLLTVASGPVSGERRVGTYFVEYALAPEPDQELGGGPTSVSVRSGREMRVLLRRLWLVKSSTAWAALAGAAGGKPLDIAAATSAGFTLIEESPLCHYVTSMNVEVFADGVYYQLHDGGANPYPASMMPLGDDPSDPGMPRKIRVTLRVLDGAAERAERCLMREIWIPLE